MIVGADILDLYAGTGSYSFELLSRGARSAVMVESNPDAVKLIRENIRTLGVEHCSTVVQRDVLEFLSKATGEDVLFDVVMVAPPYFSGLDVSTMLKLGERPPVRAGGVVVLQQHRRETPVLRAGRLKILRTYKYGQTVLTLYGIGALST